ncbi:hypothetical protein [Corynebacterium aquilae]|uniref:Uncharacterized protein n=1 Tax=Corynebacterium aquilae DSM 44791 TaxID=1431546 RepID=A0A1L7CFM3_9CORY|nr:hypothetical protein [Corynebacterium aquilae]APT84626.1 hypothetical protein CAQU_05575 [Corynebacterium aquilae DSM 44791]
MFLQDPELQPIYRSLAITQAAIFSALCLVWGLDHNFDLSIHIPLSVATAFSALGCVAIFSYRSGGAGRSWLLGQQFEAVVLVFLAATLGVIAAISPIAYMLLDNGGGNHPIAHCVELIAYGIVYVCLAFVIVVTAAKTEKRYRLIGLPLCVVLLIITVARGQLDNILIESGKASPHWLRLIPPFELTPEWTTAFAQLGILALISLAALVVVYIKRSALPRA